MNQSAMQIWIDADACPKVAKEILYRAAEKRQILTILVANSRFAIPPSSFIAFQTVPGGFDQADTYISTQCKAGDLVITADIPLAAAVIEKGGLALSPRGELFSPENIRSRLTMRDFMDELRGSGIMTGGPKAYSPRDRQEFSNALDRLLTANGF